MTTRSATRTRPADRLPTGPEQHRTHRRVRGIVMPLRSNMIVFFTDAMTLFLSHNAITVDAMPVLAKLAVTWSRAPTEKAGPTRPRGESRLRSCFLFRPRIFLTRKRYLV